MIRRFKVVEVAPVHEESLEEVLNRLAPEGWELDRVEFVQPPGVRRPSLAYLFFVRDEGGAAAEEEAG